MNKKKEAIRSLKLDDYLELATLSETGFRLMSMEELYRTYRTADRGWDWVWNDDGHFWDVKVIHKIRNKKKKK